MQCRDRHREPSRRISRLQWIDLCAETVYVCASMSDREAIYCSKAVIESSSEFDRRHTQFHLHPLKYIGSRSGFGLDL